ncbi:hypothetical protein Cni_G26203 [Canna indica]|uniref:Reverse transcriptase n=1 Tax=Canna indica TaxID=4628 RepID=A0AAQ3L395_9LILI|nr:hypothetical protein Cni_G26203 [Canna indica]
MDVVQWLKLCQLLVDWQSPRGTLTPPGPSRKGPHIPNPLGPDGFALFAPAWRIASPAAPDRSLKVFATAGKPVYEAKPIATPTIKYEIGPLLKSLMEWPSPIKSAICHMGWLETILIVYISGLNAELLTLLVQMGVHPKVFPDCMHTSETHFDDILAARLTKSFGRYWCGVSQPSNGASGGLLLAWESFVLQVQNPHKKFATGFKYSRFALSDWNRNKRNLVCFRIYLMIPIIKFDLLNNWRLLLDAHNELLQQSLYNKAMALRRQITQQWWCKAKPKQNGFWMDSAYFHRIVTMTMRRRTNQITSISLPNGLVLHDINEILNAFAEFDKELRSPVSLGTTAIFSPIQFSMLNASQCDSLIDPFSVSEIWNVVLAEWEKPWFGQFHSRI